MPDFWWNVGMCLLMGAAAGGVLPVADSVEEFQGLLV
jgi:hypothetical protein